MCTIIVNIVDIVDSKDVKYESFNFYDDISYKNYSHIDSLVNGVDIIGQMHNLTVVNENGNQWLIKLMKTPLKKEAVTF